MNGRIKMGMLLCIIGIISLTLGISYSFFHYAQTGLEENIISSGKIAFMYTEVLGVGNEIHLTDALPMSDEIGKIQTLNENSFDFKITSNTVNNNSVPYEVTVRENRKSNLEEKNVKVYLTELNSNQENEILFSTFHKLKQTNKIEKQKYIEKIIYQGEIPANQNNYEKSFRLRMWVDQDAETNLDNLSSNKTFSVTINVYSNGTVVMSEERENQETEIVIEEKEENTETVEDVMPNEEPTPSIPEVVPPVVETPPSVEQPSPPVEEPKDNPNDSDIRMDQEKKRLTKYPKWGEVWATLKIPDIGLAAPIYHGDTADIIEKGIGHYSGSYFPGEGASVVILAHNSKEHFMRLPELQIGAKIIIEAVYGTLTYEVTSTKIIEDTDTDSLPIQKEEEILMMYTCYPVGTEGYKTQRYVVYTKLVSENYY